jgi:hypothetical protein
MSVRLYCVTPESARLRRLLTAGVPPRRYNRAVEARRLSLDTSPEIERLQIEAWRRMSPVQKAAIVSGLTQAVFDLAHAGVRQRHPGATLREQFLRVAVITLGPDLARKAYPEVVRLDPP